MKDNSEPPRCVLLSMGFVLILASLLFSGCSTTRKVDWNSRVGSYTYDQAISELGPPDKQAKLSDGRTVAEWIAGRAGGGGLSVGTGFYGSNAGVGVGTTVPAGSQDRALRLTFDTNGRLSAWSKNY